MARPHRYWRLAAFLATAFMAGAASPAWAQAEVRQGRAEAGVFKKIREQGGVYVGYRESDIPFSYMDERQQIFGYSWELCSLIVQAIGTGLSIPDLRLMPVPVTSNSRFLMIRGGALDLECGSTVATESRQRYVAFSLPIFVAGIKVMVRADSSIKGLQDLDGKRVVTTQGSGAEHRVKTASSLRNAQLSFISGRDHADSMELLGSGRADALVLDEALLAALRGATPDPGKFHILDESLAIESYAISIQKDDPEFKTFVDGILEKLMKSGQLEKIYNKWFLSPIPPHGINLNLPMSPLLKAAIQNPNGLAN